MSLGSIMKHFLSSLTSMYARPNKTTRTTTKVTNTTNFSFVCANERSYTYNHIWCLKSNAGNIWRQASKALRTSMNNKSNQQQYHLTDKTITGETPEWDPNIRVNDIKRFDIWDVAFFLIFENFNFWWCKDRIHCVDIQTKENFLKGK